MSNTATTTRTAAAFANMVNEMIEARRQYAADHDFTATDDEIAASVKASLIKMMAEG
jgi:hypothetical protein